MAGGGTEWRSKRGALGLWQPTDAMLMIQLRGHGEGAFAALIIERYEPIAASGKRLDIFFDMPWMNTYDSPLRAELTDRFRHDRRRMAIHVLSRSKLVNMGVAVANLALGGIIRSYPDRGAFTAGIEDAAKKGGAEGFAQRAGLETQEAWSTG